jgi:hypothetical protein
MERPPDDGNSDHTLPGKANRRGPPEWQTRGDRWFAEL